MSEKRARQIRRFESRIEDLDRRMCAVEERRAEDDAWSHALYQVQVKGAVESAEARAAAKRHARQAERTARTWKYIAYAALVATIIVEIIAIWAIYYKEPEVPPLVIQPEQAVTITADEPEIGVPIAQLLEG